MKKQLVSLVARSLLVLLLTCGLALANVEQPQLLKLKHAVLSPTSEQVVLQLNGSYSPKVFTLKDENPRVVFDFADMTHSREIKPFTTTNGSIVKRVRVGMHSGESAKTRIVFDVATLKGVTYTQHFDDKTSSLVVQFTGPEKTATPSVQPTRTETAAPAAVPSAAKPTPPAAPTEPEQGAVPVQKAEEQAVAAPAPAASVPEPTPRPQAAQELPAEQPAAPAAVETAAKPVTTAPQPPAAPEKEAVKKEEAAPQEPRPGAAEQKVPAKTEAPQTAVKGKGEAAKPAENPQLEYVKFDASSPKGEMVLFKLNGFHPPAVHGVEEGTPRVICDFNNTKLVDTTKNLIKTDGKFVKAIRTTRTKKPERVRVVVELEPNRSYDLQQVFFKEDNLFVLIVNTVKK